MATLTAAVAAVGCSQASLVARSLQVVAGIGDNSPAFCVARLAEEAKAAAAVAAAAAAGLSVQQNSDSLDDQTSLVDDAIANAATEYSGLLESVIKPLYDSKSVVSGSQFRCLFPALDCAVRCKSVNANFHKALLVVAVHCNPAIREPLPGSNTFVELRSKMIGTVLHAIRVQPDAFPKPADVLQALCAGSALGASDLDVICGKSGFRSDNDGVRTAVLNAIAPNDEVIIAEGDEVPPTLLGNALWMACYDPDEDRSQKALAIWEASGFEIDEGLATYAQNYLGDSDETLRSIAAFAVAGVLESIPDIQVCTLSSISPTAFVVILDVVSCKAVRTLRCGGLVSDACLSNFFGLVVEHCPGPFGVRVQRIFGATDCFF